MEFPYFSHAKSFTRNFRTPRAQRSVAFQRAEGSDGGDPGMEVGLRASLHHAKFG